MKDSLQAFFYAAMSEGAAELTSSFLHGGFMEPHAVKVPVTASVPVECEFWSEDDGWAGTCARLSLSVRRNNFEDAKKNMEAALESYLSSILRDRQMAA